MTKRKKKVLTIQLLIFFSAIILLYSTYYKKDYSDDLMKKVDNNIESVGSEKTNNFKNIEYKGVDLNGNRYIIRSETADFEVDKPELINMQLMKTVFYFKDGSTLYVEGDSGTYNSKNKNMTFRENIVAEYQDNFVYADNLDYFNTKDLLNIYGNVRTESVEGEIIADNLKINLASQTLGISMFDIKKEVTVNLRK